MPRQLTAVDDSASASQSASFRKVAGDGADVVGLRRGGDGASPERNEVVDERNSKSLRSSSAASLKKAALSAVRNAGVLKCDTKPAASTASPVEEQTPKRMQRAIEVFPSSCRGKDSGASSSPLALLEGFSVEASSSSPLNVVPPHIRKTPALPFSLYSEVQTPPNTRDRRVAQLEKEREGEEQKELSVRSDCAVPLPFRRSFARVASAVGSVRQSQLQLLLSLLGDLRCPVPLLQVVGGAGTGKSFLVRLLLEESNISHGFALAEAAGALGGSVGRTQLYGQLLGSLGLTLRHEAEVCASPLSKLAERLPPEAARSESQQRFCLSLKTLQQVQLTLAEVSRLPQRTRVISPDAFVETIQQLLVASAAALKATAKAGEAAQLAGFGEEGLEAKRLSEELVERSVLLVVDGLECLRRFFPELLQLFLRLHELLFGLTAVAWTSESPLQDAGSRSVTVMFIGRELLPPEALEGMPSPPAVLFPPYSRDETAFVLQKNFLHLALPLLEVVIVDEAPPDFNFRLELRDSNPGQDPRGVKEAGVWIVPTGSDGGEAIDILKVWRRFCGDCSRLLHAQCASDFSQMQFVCRELWGQALRLFTRTQRASALSLMNEHLRSSAGAASKQAFSRLSPDLVECRVSHAEALSVWGQTVAAADSAMRTLHLPRLSLTLLLAAFLAAYTPKTSDRQLLRDTCGELLLGGAGGGRKRKRKAAEDALQVLHEGSILPKALPRTFGLARWLALAEIIARRPLVLEESSLLPHVCRLLRLRLVGFNSASLAQRGLVGGASALSAVFDESTDWVHSVGWLPQRTLEAMRTSASTRATGGSLGATGAAQLFLPSAKFVFLAETELVLQAARTLKVPLEQLM